MLEALVGEWFRLLVSSKIASKPGVALDDEPLVDAQDSLAEDLRGGRHGCLLLKNCVQRVIEAPPSQLVLAGSSCSEWRDTPTTRREGVLVLVLELE